MYLQDTHAIRTGDIATDMRAFRWVCVGETSTDRGAAYVFVREATGLNGTSKIKDRMWVKTFSQTDAFTDMFKDANAFAR
jgi:hypothetical protein